MTNNRRPARVVSPGKVISKELEARGWTQRDLAEVMARPYQAINEIIKGSKQITPIHSLVKKKSTKPETARMPSVRRMRWRVNIYWIHKRSIVL